MMTRAVQIICIHKLSHWNFHNDISQLMANNVEFLNYNLNKHGIASSLNYNFVQNSWTFTWSIGGSTDFRQSNAIIINYHNQK
jgi:hypothetical protein